MTSNYEFFKRPVVLTGRHASMAKALWQRENPQSTFFKRLIDLYKIAPIVGYLEERKGKKDASTDETATVFLEQINREKDDLENIMTMILMAEYADSGLYKQADAVKEAFKGPKSQEEFDHCMGIFDTYARGGIEVMYEELIVKGSTYENAYSSHLNTGALMEFLGRYGLKEI